MGVLAVSETRTRVSALVRQAKTELHAGNREEALTLLKKAMAIDPGSSAVTDAILEMEKESAAAAKLAQIPPQRPQQQPQARPASTTTPTNSAPEPAREAPAEQLRPAPKPVSQKVTARSPESVREPEARTSATQKAAAKPAQQQAPAARPAPAPPSAARQVVPGQPSTKQASPRPSAPGPEARQSSVAKQAVPQASIPKATPAPGALPGQQAQPAGKALEQRTAAAAPEPRTPERKREADLEDNLKELYDASEKALQAGDEAGAMGFLRKARELAPDKTEATQKIRVLQRRVKAGSMVGLAARKAAEKNFTEAVATAKEAFALWPQVPGLSELLDSLETPDADAGKEVARKPERQEKPKQQGQTRVPAQGPDAGADEYVRRVREQIQLSAIPTAAEIAAEGLEKYPGHELLSTFVEKFGRMGLLKRG